MAMLETLKSKGAQTGKSASAPLRPEWKALHERISTEIRSLYDQALEPVRARTWFPPPSGAEIDGAESLVLLLGNHSSGKSSFINHYLGSEIQKTGLAPTDDGFTVIRYTATSEEYDGQALVGNEELPFGQLREFGPRLVNHLRLKGRPIGALRGVTLVDSPGMIDAPAHGDRTQSDRGYDFAGVVRWFAERADLVLLFFDPHKPGTTDETLRVLNDALHGIEHKLMLVFNKVDEFASLSDFARAYGTLCWNLARVIRTKDLPLIFTTYLPVRGAQHPWGEEEGFERVRAELVGEIRRAPRRRLDNMITQLEDYAERLHMHASLIDGVARRVRRMRWLLYGLIALGVGTPLALHFFVGLPWERLRVPGAIGAGIAAIALVVLLWFWAGARPGRYGFWNKLFASEGRLRDDHAQLHADELVVRKRTDDLGHLLETVLPTTERTIHLVGLRALRPVRHKLLRRLEAVYSRDVKTLRAELHKTAADPNPRKGERKA